MWISFEILIFFKIQILRNSAVFLRITYVNVANLYRYLRLLKKPV